MAKVPPFGELMAATTTSAVHLEMRDAYTPDDQRFLDWQAGKLLPEHANPEWSAIVRSHTARGVHFRRTRVVSEPLAPFIRYEYEVTAAVSIRPGSKSGGWPGGAGSICACPSTITGCSTAGWCASTTSPGPGRSSKTSWRMTLPS